MRSATLPASLAPTASSTVAERARASEGAAHDDQVLQRCAALRRGGTGWFAARAGDRIGGTSLTAIPNISTPDRAAGPPAAFVRPHSKRRPSGEPPALPRAMNASGKWWLALALSVIGCWLALALTRRTGYTLDVIDHSILQRIVSLRSAWLTRVM